MSPKWINVKFLKEARKELGLTQDEFAKAASLSTRTMINLEAGAPCRPGTLEKIEKFLLESDINGGPTDDRFIKNNLKVTSTSHKHVGRVESNKSLIDEKEYVVPNMSNADYPYIPRIKDPYDNDEYRHVEEEDYIILERHAVSFDDDEEAIAKLFENGAKENTLWHASSFLAEEDSQEAITALEKLEEVLNLTQYSRTDAGGLSKITKDVRQQSELFDAYSRVIESGLSLFWGVQNLTQTSNYIFFVERAEIKSIVYEVESAHPKFMNRKKIPYYTLYKVGPTTFRLVDMPASVSEATADPDEFPSHKEERDWIDLSYRLIKEFSKTERDVYERHCRNYYPF